MIVVDPRAGHGPGIGGFRRDSEVGMALLEGHPTYFDRFLEFERWWNGFYFLGREEILSIVRDLSIGNRLENGEVVVDGHCRADLTRVRTPLVIFSSYGDNITPPHQALGWLRAVHPSTEALIAAGQRVVYLLGQKVGHLGIFVSADVALREHRSILHNADHIAALKPGLYEMRLSERQSTTGAAPAQFVPRRLEDIRFEPFPPGFERVERLSRALDEVYSTLVSPVVRFWSTPASAKLLEQGHPMRSSRRFWSEGTVPAWAALPAIKDGAAFARRRGPRTRRQSLVPVGARRQ